MEPANHSPEATWDETATIEEVREFALREFAHCLSEFTLAYQRHDSVSMSTMTTKIRHVSTRLDQFRRLSIRRWDAATAAHPTTTKGNQ